MSSDYFGIGETVHYVIGAMFDTLRGTGRTSDLIELVEPGDCVVFVNHKQARQFNERNWKNGVYIVVSDTLYGIPQETRGLPIKRLILDHVLVEKLYLDAICDVERNIRRTQADYSRSR